MDNERYKGLVHAVREQAGDAFRCAFSYTANDWTTLYVRDDIATEQLKQALDDVIARARETEPIVDRAIYQRAGDVQATVELHEEAVLLHFREGAETGVLVSPDRDVAQGLGTFVGQMTDLLGIGESA